MSPLRTRFIEDLQLHGYSSETQSAYVDAIARLARHYGQSPDLLTEEQIRKYFLFLTLEKKVARSTATIALCALKFLFQHTLQRNWSCFQLLRPPKSKKVPVVLSAEQFIGRFLRHVLPKGLVNVRSYGLWSSTLTDRLEKARTLLAAQGPQPQTAPELPRTEQASPLPEPAPLCPKCKTSHLICIATLPPQRTRAP